MSPECPKCGKSEYMLLDGLARWECSICDDVNITPKPKIIYPNGKLSHRQLKKIKKDIQSGPLSRGILVSRPGLSLRAQEWHLVAFLSIASKAIHDQSLNPEEGLLVGEIARSYMDREWLSNFHKQTLEWVLSEIWLISIKNGPQRIT